MSCNTCNAQDILRLSEQSQYEDHDEFWEDRVEGALSERADESYFPSVFLLQLRRFGEFA